MSRILELQGVGWVARKAIGMATVTLDMRHITDPSTGVERIEIEQTVPGRGTREGESRILDWAERTKEDGPFGSVGEFSPIPIRFVLSG